MKGFKQFLKIYFLFLSIGSLSGQDLIVMQSGKELFGKITDITSKEVKYIKYKSTDQKKISLMKADIFMIKYKNGKKILFDSPNSSPVTTTSNVAINQTAPVPANETSSIKESNISNDSINKRDEKNRNANFISPFKTVSLGFDGFGFLMFGPRIISELRITPKTYLSAHLRYGYAGLLVHMIYMLENPNGVRVSPANIGFGTGIKSFVMIRERGGLYLGGFVDLSFGGYTNRIGYPDEKTGSNSQFNLCSNIGYRWLLGSDFTLSLGAYSGLSLPLSGIYSHKNQPGKVYIDNGNVYPLAAIEIMVSKQW